MESPRKTYEPNRAQQRPAVCLGCCPSLIRQRRAVPGRMCDACLAERVETLDRRGADR